MVAKASIVSRERANLIFHWSLFGRSFDWLIDCWLIELLIDLLIDWLIDCPDFSIFVDVSYEKRRHAESVVRSRRDFWKLYGDKVKISWGPGRGIKAGYKEWNWDADTGICEIKSALLPTNCRTLAEGCELVTESIPERLKARFSDKEEEVKVTIAGQADEKKPSQSSGFVPLETHINTWNGNFDGFLFFKWTEPIYPLFFQLSPQRKEFLITLWIFLPFSYGNVLKFNNKCLRRKILFVFSWKWSNFLLLIWNVWRLGVDIPVIYFCDFWSVL